MSDKCRAWKVLRGGILVQQSVCVLLLLLVLDDVIRNEAPASLLSPAHQDWIEAKRLLAIEIVGSSLIGISSSHRQDGSRENCMQAW